MTEEDPNIETASREEIKHNSKILSGKILRMFGKGGVGIDIPELKDMRADVLKGVEGPPEEILEAAFTPKSVEKLLQELVRHVYASYREILIQSLKEQGRNKTLPTYVDLWPFVEKDLESLLAEGHTPSRDHVELSIATHVTELMEQKEELPTREKIFSFVKEMIALREASGQKTLRIELDPDNDSVEDEDGLLNLIVRVFAEKEEGYMEYSYTRKGKRLSGREPLYTKLDLSFFDETGFPYNGEDMAEYNHETKEWKKY